MGFSGQSRVIGNISVAIILMTHACPRNRLPPVWSQLEKIRVPALLVRGTSSELVSEAHAREFLELVPHAEYMDVAGARHMVAGDRNDRFSAAILQFLGKLG